MNRSYLVDSSIYVFRAWFTLPDDLLDAEGEPVNAVYGFADFLHRLLNEVRPTRIALAFDESLTSSHRNDIYPDYKANREPAPEELKRQFRLCRELVRTLGLTELASDRFEADDLIGTLVQRERDAGNTVTLITGDKDLAQLISHDADLWWEFAKDKRMDRKGIEKTFGVPPERIADLLALAGDKVDNIPGIPGVGIATAAKLLRRFDSLDNLLDNIPQVAQMKIRGAARLRELVDTHQDTVRLARKLTGIHCEVDLPADLTLLPQPVDTDALEALFDRLDFGRPRRERWYQLLTQLHGAN